MQFPFNILRDAEFDAVGFGTNAVDFLIQVPQYPAFNSKIELSEYTRAAGGEVATTMAGMQRLGLKAAYVGRFGSDDAGKFGLQSLVNEGVDVSYAEIIEGAQTQIAFIVIDQQTGERTVIWQRDRSLAYVANEAPLEAATRTKVLHFTPHDAAACLQMAKRAKEIGSIVSIDIDNVFEGVEDLLSYVDVMIMSADFPEKFLGISDYETSLREIKRRFGSGIVGVTLGENGSILLAEDTFIETPSFAVPNGCKDTTGAGDSFRVGLLYGLLRNVPIEQAARMANAVAALKCRAVGARTALPTENELNEMLTAGR